MLEKLRRGAAKVMVFALFAVLILSFAVWGIGDSIRTGGQGPIAEVGDQDISAQEFTAALQQRRQLLAQQFGQPLTPEQSRSFGVDAAVLAELVNGAAISNYASKLGIRLSDETVAALIRADPAFHGPDNQFNRAVFDERMRQAGFTEHRYFAERRANEVREQLTDAFAAGVTIPDTLVDIVHKFRGETRTVQFVRLDPEKAQVEGSPDEQALKSIYEQQKSTFTLPERRKVAVLLLTPEALGDRTTVTDAEVRAAWEQSQAAWNVPERRRIQQIPYRTRTEAEGEKKAIAEGKSFLLAALEVNAQGRLDQGLIARREISDSNFAKTAFELPLNTVSDPVQVRGGWLLLRVTEIQPAKERTFDEVKDEVRRSLEENKRHDLMRKLHDEIEDKRGATDAAEKLKAISTALKLPLLEAESVDAKGLGPDGKPAFSHPDAERFVASAFEGDAMTPREVITLSGGGEAWVEVIDVKPAVTKPFEDVKADLERMWRERERRTVVSKTAQAFADRIKAGASIETVAREAGLEIQTSPPFKRSSTPSGLSPAAVRVAFTLPKGGAGTAPSADDKTRIVLMVSDVKPADPPTKDEADALREQLVQEFQQDALQTYISALRNRQKVQVHENVYKRAVGLDQTP